MKLFSILVLLAIVVAGFGYYQIFYIPVDEFTSKTSPGVDEVLSEVEVNVGERTGFGTLTELRGWNEDLECSVVYESEDGTSDAEGTYFVSGDKMRGDFLTDSPEFDDKILSSMIVDENDMYIWSEIEGELYGVKMKASVLDNQEIDAGEPVSLDSRVKYNCLVWENVDNTVFVPPSDILFQDMDEMLGVEMEYGTVYEEGEF